MRACCQQSVAFLLLVSAGIAVRLMFQDLPNFAPVAALALFSGYFFTSRLLAVAAPVTVMLVTDWFLGSYHPLLMVAVYGMLAMPVLFRGLLRRELSLDATSRPRSALAAAGLIGCGLVSSVAFFVVTNFATWLVGGLYQLTWEGLCTCYVQAVPFFRYTVAGDLVFATLLFGGYALLRQTARAERRVPVTI